MSTSRANVPTDHASRYLQQLCRHWAHKFQVAFDASQGHIDFGDGRACGLKAGEGVLEVRAIADDEALPQLRHIIEKHLNRFAHREGELSYDWSAVEDA